MLILRTISFSLSLVFIGCNENTNGDDQTIQFDKKNAETKLIQLSSGPPIEQDANDSPDAGLVFRKITCTASGVHLVYDDQLEKGTLSINKRPIAPKNYALSFKDSGEVSDGAGCTNPGPFLMHQSLPTSENVDVKIWLNGGFANTWSATIRTPDFSLPIDVRCSESFFNK